jgi:hypothetical protein
MRLLAGFVLGWIVLSVHGASAEGDGGGGELKDLNKSVFAKSNAKALCKTGNVDRVRLIERMLVLNGQTVSDALAATSRSAANSVEGRLAQYIYDNDDAREAIYDRLGLWLQNGWLSNKFYAADKRLQSEVDAAGAFLSGRYQIKCLMPAKDDPGQVVDSSINAFAQHFRIRGTVRDLQDDTSKENKLQETSSATFNYTDDHVKSRKTSGTEGVVGIVVNSFLPKGDGSLSDLPEIMPFLYVKNSWNDPKSKTNPDIDVLQPGLALSKAFDLGGKLVTADTQVDLSRVIDSGQGASEWVAGLRIEPSFYTGERTPRLFGERIPVGPLEFLPRVAFVLREHDIDEAGNNPFFQGISDYTSIGYEGSLQLFFNTGIEALDSLKFYAVLLDLQDVHDQINVSRETYGMSYTLPGLNKVTINAEYVNGRDMNTLQMEDKFTSKIGVRF